MKAIVNPGHQYEELKVESNLQMIDPGKVHVSSVLGFQKLSIGTLPWDTGQESDLPHNA